MASQLYELTLSGLSYGGEAVGRLSDGRTAFVGFGLPGERVQIEILEDKGRFVRGGPCRVAARINGDQRHVRQAVALPCVVPEPIRKSQARFYVSLGEGRS